MYLFSALSGSSLSSGDREKTGLLVGLAGILTNGVIFALELFSGLRTGSATLTADAFHNLTDAMTAVMTVAAFLLASRPSSRRHPFGFGRVEYLFSLLMGLVIGGIGLFLGYASIGKLLHPAPVQFHLVPFLLMVVSIVLKLAYSLLGRLAARRTNSQTLRAAAMDSLGDVLVLTAAVLSLGLSAVSDIPADGLLGLGVSGFLLCSGAAVVQKAAGSLIGRAPDPALAAEITSAVLRTEAITGVHDLAVHDYGPEKVVASIHAEVPAETSLLAAHEAASRAERELRERGVELVVHIEPMETDGDRTNLRDSRDKDEAVYLVPLRQVVGGKALG